LSSQTISAKPDTYSSITFHRYKEHCISDLFKKYYDITLMNNGVNFNSQIIVAD